MEEAGVLLRAGGLIYRFAAAGPAELVAHIVILLNVC